MIIRDFNESLNNGYFSLGKIQSDTFSEFEQLSRYYNIIINFGNAIELLKDDVPLTIPAGTIACLTPGSEVKLKNVSDDENYFVTFNRNFYCVELHDEEVSCNGLLFNGAIQAPVIPMAKEDRNSISLLIEVLKDELNTKDKIQGEMLQLLLKRLIIKTARLFRDQLIEFKHLSDEDTDIIREFNALVEKNFREHHKVADYADMLFKSPKTLSNLFGKFSDSTPSQIIQDRIYLEAKRLLKFTDKPAKEIAFDLGFDDPTQFSRFFKKMGNQTTQEFRDFIKKEISSI